MSPQGACGCVALVLLTVVVVILELTLPWHIAGPILAVYNTSLVIIILVSVRRRKALRRASHAHESSSATGGAENPKA